MANEGQDWCEATSKLRVDVGQPWELDSVQIHEQNDGTAAKVKTVVIVSFAGLFGTMFAAYGTYALLHGDREMLGQVWQILTYGLAVIGAWAAGRGLNKIASVDHER